MKGANYSPEKGGESDTDRRRTIRKSRRLRLKKKREESNQRRRNRRSTVGEMLGVRGSAGKSLATAAVEKIAERAAALHDHEARRSAKKAQAKKGGRAKSQEKRPTSRVNWNKVNKKLAGVRLSDPRQSLVDLFNTSQSDEDGAGDAEAEEKEAGTEMSEDSEDEGEGEPNSSDERFLKNENEPESDPEYEPTDPAEYSEPPETPKSKPYRTGKPAIDKILHEYKVNR